MKSKNIDIEFNGSFEDSDLDDQDNSEDEDEESDDDTLKRRKKSSVKIKKIFYPNNKIIMNVSDTIYPVVKFVGKVSMKWKLQYDPDQINWDLMWTDNAVQPETLAKMQPHQKINHFPGMYQLARKNYLGRNLTKMFKQFPEEYDFFPRTWLLPAEYSDFRTQFQKGKTRTFIIKPEASCQGRGIFLTRNIDDLNIQDHYVAQRYLHRPFLIDGLKFDLRLYVLLAGCDPLRIYLFKEGLARFATEPYIAPNTSNLDNVCMHLTNYAINKDSPNFVFNKKVDRMDVGHKRSFQSVLKLFQEMGRDVDKIMREIKEIIIKTFCSVQPVLQQSYRCTQSENFMNNMCFEVLGFDIFIDNQFKPWLLEVNHTPSFSTDTPLDSFIKMQLIRDTVRLMNINMLTKNEIIQERKESMQKRVLTGKKQKLTNEEKSVIRIKAQQLRDEYENANLGEYEKIYPIDSEQEEIYEKYIEEAIKQYDEWTGANIRRNPKKVKEQVEQIDKKKPLEYSKSTHKSYLYRNVQSKVNTNLRFQTTTLDDVDQIPKINKFTPHDFEQNTNGEDNVDIQDYEIQVPTKHHLNSNKLELQRITDVQGEDQPDLQLYKEYPLASRVFDNINHNIVQNQMSQLQSQLQYPPQLPSRQFGQHKQLGQIQIQQSPQFKRVSQEISKVIDLKQQNLDNHHSPTLNSLSPIYQQYKDNMIQQGQIIEQQTDEPMSQSQSRKKMFSIKRQPVNNQGIPLKPSSYPLIIKLFDNSDLITPERPSFKSDHQLVVEGKMNGQFKLDSINGSGQFLKQRIFNLHFIPSQKKRDVSQKLKMTAIPTNALLQGSKWISSFTQGIRHSKQN